MIGELVMNYMQKPIRCKTTAFLASHDIGFLYLLIGNIYPDIQIWLCIKPL